MYQPHLERAGYQVISLTDGAEALEVAIREQPRVVVMDMMLPGTDGLAATLALKAAESTKNIPVIAISGDLSYLGLRQQLESIGAEAFLSKPFGAAKLVSEIQRLDKDRGA
jgi:CheY-like chemotaxis protein